MPLLKRVFILGFITVLETSEIQDAPPTERKASLVILPPLVLGYDELYDDPDNNPQVKSRHRRSIENEYKLEDGDNKILPLEKWFNGRKRDGNIFFFENEALGTAGNNMKSNAEETKLHPERKREVHRTTLSG